MAKAMKKLVVMMLGDSTVGKTSIVLQYCEQKFSEDAKPTVGESILLIVFNSTSLSKGSL